MEREKERERERERERGTFAYSTYRAAESALHSYWRGRLDIGYWILDIG